VPGSSSWMPYAPQGVKGFDDDVDGGGGDDDDDDDDDVRAAETSRSTVKV